MAVVTRRDPDPSCTPQSLDRSVAELMFVEARVNATDCGVSLPAGIEAAALTAQPPAVENVAAGELQPCPRVGQPAGCLS